MHTQFTPVSKGDKPAVFVRELIDGEMVHVSILKRLGLKL